MLNNLINLIFNHTPLFYLTQSIWRDEAFSYFMAKPSLFNIISNTANDFNPPLYYLLLHFWIYLVGHSDEGLRILSLFFHVATVFTAYFLARKMISQTFARFVALFTLFNPMLVYYAFEMRMYSLYAFLTVASLYFLYSRNWKWYLVFSVLGLYTHSFFPLIIFSYLVYFYVSKQYSRKLFLNLLRPFIFYLPWLFILLNQFLRSANSWLFPVDLQLVKSVLGNLFINYEGTPGGLWQITFILSLFILFFLFLAYQKKRKKSLLFILPIFTSLIPVLTFSILKRPIYVNRYLIFVSVFEVFGVAYGIWSFRSKLTRYFVASLWMAVIIFINLYLPAHNKKTDFKSTFAEINRIANKSDYTFAKTPIGFLESAYYFNHENQVYLYNPKNIKIPDYIGVTVVFPEISKSSFPSSPAKTFLVDDDASFAVVINN